jgi:hypothetical protein
MILASSFAEKHREWEGANMAAKAAREKWEKAVRAAVQNDDPPPEMPASAVAPEAPTLPRIRISDATQEAIGHLCAANPRGLLFFRDELTGWIGNFDRYGGNGGDRAFWLEAYDGKARVIDRVKFEGKPIIIPRLTVGILGGIQPDRLSSAILEGEDDGLAARFQWVWPDPIPPRRPTRSGDADFAKSAISRLLQLNMSANAEGELGPVIVRLEEKAVSLFHEWRLVHYKQRESVGGGIASSYAKAPGQLLRLSLVLEFLWWAASPDSSEPSYVSAKAIGAAAHLIETYFKPMAMRVYGDASLPKGDRLASVLAKWIIRERPQVVNAREVRRSARLPGLRVSGDVVLALTSLVEGGWLRKASQSGSGRPRSDFEVNPILWERLS